MVFTRRHTLDQTWSTIPRWELLRKEREHATVRSGYAAGALAFALGTQVALATSSHFVSASYAVSGNTLTVNFKEAGLGDQITVDLIVSDTAACINPGGHHSSAANKRSVSGGGTERVHNGRVDSSDLADGAFPITLTASSRPDCRPPMTVSCSNVTICDTDNNVCRVVLPG